MSLFLTRVRRFRERRTAGYTLLELILAMSLSMIIAAGMATAIHLYMKQLSKQQARVERELIARSVLTMIANDLRSALQYRADDYSGLNNLLQTQALIAGTITEEEVEAQEEEDEESGQNDDDPVGDEMAVSFRPTLLGSANTVMLDISRLPRLDQYNPLVERPTDQVSTPSDIKSVAYFASSIEGGIDPAISMQRSTVTGGVYRRQIDRAVANYRGEESLMQTPDEFTELVAREVAQLEFRYFDGEGWQNDWDSEEQGGLPSAVEIAIVVDPARSVGTTNYQYPGFNPALMERHRLVVYLPMSDLPSEEDE
jgi:type II secretory pathway pseudopilin PulG